MGSIFQNACLNIAAVASPNSSGGCFEKNKSSDLCFMVSSNTNETHFIGARVLDKKGRLVSTDDFNNHYPLLSRAWVFQERLLSPHLLQCNYGEFAFECLQSSSCECNSYLAPHPRLGSGNADRRNFTSRRRLFMETQDGQNATMDVTLDYWKSTIQQYMQLELSHPSDVLPAIAGCAQALAFHLKLTYVAGMGKEKLSTDLLWYVKPLRHKEPPEPRPKDSTAPSWS